MQKQIIFLLATALTSAPSFASKQTAFDLVKTNDLICKVESVSSKTTCYDRLGSIDGLQNSEKIEIMTAIENLDQLRKTGAINSLEQLKSTGGVLFLSDENLNYLRNSFSRLSVRNMAINKNGIKVVKDQNGEEFNEIPFLASVYWQSKSKHFGKVLQGTIHFEGLVKIPVNLKLQNLSENNKLSTLFAVSQYSDSNTEQKVDAYRILETAARTIQIQSVFGKDADLDAKTQELMTNMIGPAVVGELLLVPLMESMINTFNDLFKN